MCITAYKRRWLHVQHHCRRMIGTHTNLDWRMNVSGYLTRHRAVHRSSLGRGELLQLV